MLQKNYDGQLKKNQQQDGLEQLQPPKNRTGTQKPIKDKNSVVIRGVTFYKAEEESYKEEEEEEEMGKGKSSTSKISLWLIMLLLFYIHVEKQ